MPAVAGQAGRMQVPPEGGMFVRDPAAARAQAIRDKVALFQREGLPVPPHLQSLLDGLPVGEDDSAVELVNSVTGEHIADVDVDAGETPPANIGSTSNIFPVKEKAPVKDTAPAPGYTASDQPAAPAAEVHVAVVPGQTTLSSSGDLSVEVVAEETGAVLGTVSAPAEPETRVTVDDIDQGPPQVSSRPDGAHPGEAIEPESKPLAEPSVELSVPPLPKPGPPTAPRRGRPAKKVSPPQSR